ncbi:MAG: hypothetical protein RBS91_05865 [Sulfurimonadaceae bacterium]|nr:hypothetical protein [Sulfurimonadaceae bacterium]
MFYVKIALGLLVAFFAISMLLLDSLNYKQEKPQQITSTKTINSIDEGACIGCHGKNWENIALSKSLVVAQMSEQQIIDALLGYKNQHYGSDKKDIMRAQVQKYSDEELIEFAKKLSKKYSKVSQANRVSAINELACFGCHGDDWSKIALGSSKIVATMTHKEIAEALIGYKNGTFGGDKKDLMRAQVQKYSDEELVEFANTIGI